MSWLSYCQSDVATRRTLVAILRMAAYTRKNALHLLLLRIGSDKRGNITKDSSSRMLRQTPTILYNSARISCFMVLVLIRKTKVLLQASSFILIKLKNIYYKSFLS